MAVINPLWRGTIVSSTRRDFEIDLINPDAVERSVQTHTNFRVEYPLITDNVRIEPFESTIIRINAIDLAYANINPKYGYVTTKHADKWLWHRITRDSYELGISAVGGSTVALRVARATFAAFYTATVIEINNYDTARINLRYRKGTRYYDNVRYWFSKGLQHQLHTRRERVNEASKSGMTKGNHEICCGIRYDPPKYIKGSSMDKASKLKQYKGDRGSRKTSTCYDAPVGSIGRADNQHGYLSVQASFEAKASESDDMTAVMMHQQWLQDNGIE